MHVWTTCTLTKYLETKARWELHKNAAYCFELVLEAALRKTAPIRPLTSHHTNHPKMMYKTCWRSKGKLISDDLLWTPIHGHTSVGWPSKICINQLCTDTGFHHDDLPNAITDRDGRQEKDIERESRKSGLSVWYMATSLASLQPYK